MSSAGAMLPYLESATSSFPFTPGAAIEVPESVLFSLSLSPIHYEKDGQSGSGVVRGTQKLTADSTATPRSHTGATLVCQTRNNGGNPPSSSCPQLENQALSF